MAKIKREVNVQELEALKRNIIKTIDGISDDFNGQKKINILNATIKNFDKVDFVGNVRTIVTEQNIAQEMLFQIQKATGVLESFDRIMSSIERRINGENFEERYKAIDELNQLKREAQIGNFKSITEISKITDEMISKGYGYPWDVKKQEQKKAKLENSEAKESADEEKADSTSKKATKPAA